MQINFFKKEVIKMANEQYLHNQAKIRVYDHEHNKERNFKLTVKDGWGFIGDSHENNLTELRLNKDKLPLSTVRKIFNGENYVANRADEMMKSFVDDDNRVHTWVKDNGTILHEVKDPDLAKRYDLQDVMENGKSLLSENKYHLDGEVKANEPVHLVNDGTKEVSGDIVPTTKKAVASLKSAVKNQLVDLTVSPDSKLYYAGNLPSGQLTHESTLKLDSGSGATGINLDHSNIHLRKGQISYSGFTDTKTFDTEKEPKGTYIYNSDFDHAHLFDNVHAKSSMVDYGTLSNSNLESCSLKGGNYTNTDMKNVNTWVSLTTLFDSNKLRGCRFENRHVSPSYFEKNEKMMATKPFDFYDKKHLDAANKLAGSKWYSPTLVCDSNLDNIQVLRNGDVGSTINKSTLKNAFVREWISADNSELVSDKPTKPICTGRLALNNNKVHMKNKAVTYNLGEFTSKNAAEGLELKDGQEVNDQTVAQDKNAKEYNSKSGIAVKLAYLQHGHYVLNNGDEAFDNLSEMAAFSDEMLQKEHQASLEAAPAQDEAKAKDKTAGLEL